MANVRQQAELLLTHRQARLSVTIPLVHRVVLLLLTMGISCLLSLSNSFYGHGLNCSRDNARDIDISKYIAFSN